MNILSKKVTVSYLFKLLLVSTGLVFSANAYTVSSTDVAVSAASDFAGTVAGATLETQLKTYLYCNQGDGSGAQLCSMAIYVPVSLDGAISRTKQSKIVLDITAINSTVTNATGEAFATPLIAGGEIDTFGTLTGSNWDHTPSRVLPGAAGGMSLANNSSLASADILVVATNSAEVKQLRFDNTICFDGDANADFTYNTGTSTLTSQHASPATVLIGRAAGNHPAYLLSAASPEFNRDTIGMAAQFTIAYTQTVTSNTVAAHAGGCDGTDQ
jgi:hypothetical protein